MASVMTSSGTSVLHLVWRPGIVAHVVLRPVNERLEDAAARARRRLLAVRAHPTVGLLHVLGRAVVHVLRRVVL